MRILVVDESTRFREVVHDVLQGLPDVEVVGVATNGEVAIQNDDQFDSELILHDVNAAFTGREATVNDSLFTNSLLSQD